MYGTYETVDGRPAVRFERRLPYPMDAVWRAITDPAELEHWFPSAVSGDLREGGRLTFRFGDDLPPVEGIVTEFEPPRRFAFSWGPDQLRFELEPTEGGGTLLRLTDVLTQRDEAARNAAGWHVCLDRLERCLGGEDTTAPASEPTDEWRHAYEEYQRRGVPAGAAIPG
jgi:uncharacterized protein YndB with AHSA1/START domain